MVSRIRKLGQICYKTPIITLPHIDNVSHLSISSKEVPPLYPNRTLPPHTMQGCTDPTNRRLKMHKGRYPLSLVTTIKCMWKSRNHTIKHNQKSNKTFMPSDDLILFHCLWYFFHFLAVTDYPTTALVPITFVLWTVMARMGFPCLFGYYGAFICFSFIIYFETLPLEYPLACMCPLLPGCPFHWIYVWNMHLGLQPQVFFNPPLPCRWWIWGM